MCPKFILLFLHIGFIFVALAHSHKLNIYLAHVGSNQIYSVSTRNSEDVEVPFARMEKTRLVI